MTRRRMAVVTALVALPFGCTSLDGLTGAPADASTEAATDADAHDAEPADDTASAADAAPEAPVEDAGADASDGDARPAPPARLVQKAAFAYTTTLTNTLVFPAAVTAGDLLLAAVVTHNSDATLTLTVSDTLLHPWKKTVFRRCAVSSVGIQLWYAENALGGDDAIKVTQSVLSDGGLDNALGLAIFEYGGVSAFESESGQCAPAAMSAMFTPLVTTASTALLTGLFADPCGHGTMAPGAGFATVDLNFQYFYLFEDEENGGAGVPAGSYQATATNPTNSACWVASIAAFRKM